MLIAVIVATLVAIGLGVLYAMAKSSAAEFRTQAEQREAALVAERDGLTERTTSLDEQLTSVRSDLDGTTERLEEATAESERVSGQLAEATRKSDEQAERIKGQAEEISSLVSDNFSLKNRIEEAEAAAAAAIARNTGIGVGDVVDIGAAQPETLWDLELRRSERTWRTSVATNPAADDSPFEGVDDPVRLAVEIEAAALRENVGAFITIEWRTDPIEEPARRHLVVRVAQEMLEEAARSPEPSRLVATDDDGEINLRLEAIDDDEAINIIPPRITSDLLDISDGADPAITVKVAPS